MFTLRPFGTIVKTVIRLLVHCGVRVVNLQPWIDIKREKLIDNLFINAKVDVDILIRRIIMKENF